MTDFDILDSSVQLDSSVTKNKKPTLKPTQKFKFLPHRTFFGEAVFAILLQSKKGATPPTNQRSCTTFAFAQSHPKPTHHPMIIYI
jgi:hypothetical protein